MFLDLLPELQDRVLEYCDGASVKELACCSRSCCQAVHKRLYREVQITSYHLSNQHFNQIKSFDNLATARTVHLSRTKEWDDLPYRIHQNICANYIKLLKFCNPEVLHINFVPRSAFKQIMSYSNLQELHVKGVQINESGLKNICMNLKLKVLDLEETDTRNSGRNDNIDSLVHLNRLTDLEQLTLPAQCEFSDTSFAALCKLMKLKKLKICWTPATVSDSSVAELSNLHELEDLDLTGCTINDVGFSAVGRIGSLKKLVLGRNSFSNDASRHIGKLSSLKELDLSEYGKYASINGERIKLSLVHFSKLPLSKLNVSGCEINPDDYLYISAMTSLTDLDVSDSKSIKVESLRYFGTLNKLEVLNLSKCSRIKGNQCLSDVCKLASLRELDLTRCNIPSQSLSCIPNLLQLTKLNLSSNHKLCSKGITHICKVPTLRELYVSWTKISDLCVSVISESLLQLEVLDLSYCCKLTNQCVASLEKLLKLEVLDLTCCHFINGEGILQLHTMSWLQKIHYRCQPNDDLDHLLASLPALRVIGQADFRDDDEFDEFDRFGNEYDSPFPMI